MYTTMVGGGGAHTGASLNKEHYSSYMFYNQEKHQKGGGGKGTWVTRVPYAMFAEIDYLWIEWAKERTWRGSLQPRRVLFLSSDNGNWKGWKIRQLRRTEWIIIMTGMLYIRAWRYYPKKVRFYFYIFIFYKTLTGPNQDATEIKRHKKPGSLEEYHFA